MYKLLLFVTTLLFFTLAKAQTDSPNFHDLLIKINFSYQKLHSNDSYAISNHLIFSSNRSWMIVPGDKSASNKPPLLLLAQADKYDSKSIRLNFIVIDLENKPEIIAKPVIITKINQEGRMVLGDKQNKISINVLPQIKA